MWRGIYRAYPLDKRGFHGGATIDGGKEGVRGLTIIKGYLV